MDDLVAKKCKRCDFVNLFITLKHRNCPHKPQRRRKYIYVYYISRGRCKSENSSEAFNWSTVISPDYFLEPCSVQCVCAQSAVVHQLNNILKSRANPALLYGGCAATAGGVMSEGERGGGVLYNVTILKSITKCCSIMAD